MGDYSMSDYNDKSKIDENTTITGDRVKCDHCDYWVPKGMEYMLQEHKCIFKDDLNKNK